MINQLLRLGALIATGRFLKPRLRGLLLLALVWTVLWFVHSEYVNYVELSGNTRYVLHATLLKLGLYGLSVGLYVLLVERRLWPRPLKIPAPATPASATPVPGSAATPTRDGDDGFDFLRDKPRLKGSTEKLLDR